MTLASLVVMVGPTSVVTKDQLDRLDAQFASAKAFEIVWSVGGGRTETVEYLTAVAPHRPNVRLTTAAADRAVAEAQGRYVVLLAAEDQPHPGALERLLSFAEKHRLDTVLGRIAVPGSPVPTGLLRDVPGPLEPSQLADPAPDTVLVAVRRDLAVVGDAGLEPVGHCGVMGQESVSSRPGVGASAAELAVAEAAWTGDELVVRGRLPVDESPVVAVLEHRASGRQVVVGLADRTPEDDGSVLVRLAPRRALSGRPLLDGVWQALIQSRDADGGTHLRPLAWTRCPPALLGTEIVIPVSVAGTLALDVGPTTRGLVLPGRAEPSVVEETVRGSLLQLRLPEIHTDGFVGLDGLVGFGDVQVPARLEVDELGVCLRAMATGVSRHRRADGPVRPDLESPDGSQPDGERHRGDAAGRHPAHRAGEDASRRAVVPACPVRWAGDAPARPVRRPTQARAPARAGGGGPPPDSAGPRAAGHLGRPPTDPAPPLPEADALILGCVRRGLSPHGQTPATAPGRPSHLPLCAAPPEDRSHLNDRASIDRARQSQGSTSTVRRAPPALPTGVRLPR